MLKTSNNPFFQFWFQILCKKNMVDGHIGFLGNAYHVLRKNPKGHRPDSINWVNMYY